MTEFETETPPAIPKSHSPDVYHSALVRALGFQVFFVLLAGLMLDSGLFLRFYSAVSIGYWISAFGILVARPGKWGLRYLRHGVVVAFGLVVIASSYWHEWVLGIFGEKG